MSFGTPDVVAEGEVVCPCGYFRLSVDAVSYWRCGVQAVCPNCSRLLEVFRCEEE